MKKWLSQLKAIEQSAKEKKMGISDYINFYVLISKILSDSGENIFN